MVFDRRPGQCQTATGLEQETGLCRLTVGVLDRLRFVQNDEVETPVLQLHNVAAQRSVGSQDQVCVVELRNQLLASGSGRLAFGRAS